MAGPHAATDPVAAAAFALALFAAALLLALVQRARREVHGDPTGWILVAAALALFGLRGLASFPAVPGVDLAALEAVFATLTGGWLIVLGGAFLLRRRVDTVSPALLVLAGIYVLLWRGPALDGLDPSEAFHVSIAQPVFLLLLAGAVFPWVYGLFERHADGLERSQAKLAEALSLQHTLVDGLNHDVRNPLAAACTSTGPAPASRTPSAASRAPAWSSTT
jgi:signal transduction histidine kinase